jgi:hypothetical protein
MTPGALKLEVQRAQKRPLDLQVMEGMQPWAVLDCLRCLPFQTGVDSIMCKHSSLGRCFLLLPVFFAKAVFGGSEPTAAAVTEPKAGLVSAGRYVMPTGQVLTPAGRQVALPEMRPQALALSPDGQLW